MKPTKNRVYCKDCGRHKMLFETEKKANTFIKFNSEEIASETGIAPTRSYYCMFCNGWHVTSHKENIGVQSKTERVLELYKAEKENLALWRQQNAETKKRKREELEHRLELIENQIKLIEANKATANVEMVNIALADVEAARKIPGLRKRIKEMDDKLNALKIEIEDCNKRQAI